MTGPDVEQSSLSGVEPELTLHRQFEQVAARQPEQIAIQARCESATYGEVNRLANRLARAILLERDAGPEAVAIVLGQRSVTAAAMLGVLKSGNFYVPLASGDPPARMALILEDSGAQLLVTDREHLPLARALAGGRVRVVCLDDMAPELRDDNLAREVGPDELAYLIYTSGSTGKPKGVMQTHRTTMYTIARQIRRVTYSEGRSGVFSSLSVQAPVGVLFSALLNAGTVYLYDVQREGVDGMAAFLRQAAIQSFRCTPTIFRLLVAQLDGPIDLPALRRIELSGETVTPRDVELFKRYFARPCVLRTAFSTTEADRPPTPSPTIRSSAAASCRSDTPLAGWKSLSGTKTNTRSHEVPWARLW